MKQWLYEAGEWLRMTAGNIQKVLQRTVLSLWVLSGALGEARGMLFVLSSVLSGAASVSHATVLQDYFHELETNDTWTVFQTNKAKAPVIDLGSVVFDTGVDGEGQRSVLLSQATNINPFVQPVRITFSGLELSGDPGAGKNAFYALVGRSNTDTPAEYRVDYRLFDTAGAIELMVIAVGAGYELRLNDWGPGGSGVALAQYSLIDVPSRLTLTLDGISKQWALNIGGATMTRVGGGVVNGTSDSGTFVCFDEGQFGPGAVCRLMFGAVSYETVMEEPAVVKLSGVELEPAVTEAVAVRDEFHVLDSSIDWTLFNTVYAEEPVAANGMLWLNSGTNGGGHRSVVLTQATNVNPFVQPLEIHYSGLTLSGDPGTGKNAFFTLVGRSDNDLSSEYRVDYRLYDEAGALALLLQLTDSGIELRLNDWGPNGSGAALAQYDLSAVPSNLVLRIDGLTKVWELEIAGATMTRVGGGVVNATADNGTFSLFDEAQFGTEDVCRLVCAAVSYEPGVVEPVAVTLDRISVIRNMIRWFATDDSSLWKTANEAATALETPITLPDGREEIGLRLKMKTIDSGDANGQWEMGAPTASFTGIDDSSLQLSFYVPDISLFPTNKQAITLKVGNDVDNCRFYLMYREEAGVPDEIQLQEGWNTLSIPLDSYNSSKGTIDWSALDFMMMILWIPDDRSMPELTLCGGGWLAHANVPDSGSYAVAFDQETALYAPGETVDFDVQVMLDRPLVTDRILDVYVSDWRGNICQTNVMSIPAGSQFFTETCSFSSSEYGTYTVSAFPRDTDLYLQLPLEACFSIDHNLSNLWLSLSDELFWGINVHMGMTKNYPATEDKVIALCRRLGARMIRFDMYWDVQNPQDGVWNWIYSDRWTNRLAAHKMGGFPGLRYTPGWASSFDPDTSPNQKGEATDYKNYQPADWADWEVYVSNTVSRYKNDFSYWEIWNEPNWEFWQDPAADFCTLVEKGYDMVKAVDSSATVVMGGMAATVYRDEHDDMDWFNLRTTDGFAEDVLEAGSDSFDDMNWHVYYDGDLPEMESDVWSDMTNEAAVCGIDGKEFWHGECGYSDPAGTDVEEVFALIRLASWSRAAGSKNFTWYKIWKTMWLGLDNMQYGMIPLWDESGVAMGSPAYVAYQTCVENLSGATFDQRVGGTNGVDGFLFSKSGGKMLVVWRTGTAASWTPDSSWGAVAEVQDAMGNPLVYSGSIALGEEPVFVRFQ